MNKIELREENFTNSFNKLEHSKANIFINGKAGTGKSTFLNYFRENSKKKVVILAPTGVAAVNIRGQTIHSFFKFRPSFIDIDSIRPKKDSKVYKKIEILIIDEISMVRADIFQAIERFLRYNGPKPGQPFGGVQICVIGDLYQLPPIVGSNDREIFYQFYQSPFFFRTRAYEEANFERIEFDKVYRQSEDNFIEVLNKVRVGNASSGVLDFLNQRVDDFESIAEESPVILTTTNNIAESINHQRLESLRGETFSFAAKMEGDFNLNGDKLPAPEILNLKVGAQVMITKNDKKKRWVNGTIGIVTYLSDTTIEVRIKNHRDEYRNYVLEKEEWDNIKYTYDKEKDTVIEHVQGSYTQYPLIHAWAITIHKSQGKTLDSVYINLGRGAFAPGQLYVALSRCRKFDKIVLKNKISVQDIKCHPDIINFARG